MSENQPSKLKSALNFGAVLGLVLMVMSLITYIFALWDNKLFGYVNWLIIIVGIIVGIKKYRDEVCGGYITYGGALGFGVLMIFFASLIASVGSSVYLSFVDDSFITSTLEKTEIQLLEQGSTDEVVEMALSWTKKMMSPIGIILGGVFATTFFGLIVSLIASAFLKKEADSFENS